MDALFEVMSWRILLFWLLYITKINSISFVQNSKNKEFFCLSGTSQARVAVLVCMKRYSVYIVYTVYIVYISALFLEKKGSVMPHFFLSRASSLETCSRQLVRVAKLEPKVIHRSFNLSLIHCISTGPVIWPAFNRAKPHLNSFSFVHV